MWQSIEHILSIYFYAELTCDRSEVAWEFGKLYAGLAAFFGCKAGV